jgi:DNA-binding NarL/FixJ family response regulator
VNDPDPVRQSGPSPLGEYLRRRVDRVLSSWEQATHSSALPAGIESDRLRRFLEAFAELADATEELAGGPPGHRPQAAPAAADSRPEREDPLALLVAGADRRLSEALHGGLDPACRLETALTEDDALRRLATRAADVLLAGPGAHAIDLLRWARSASPEVPVVVVAPAGEIEALLECPDARDGFLLFPDTVDPAEVVLAARAALNSVRLGRSRGEELERLRRQAEALASLSKPFGGDARPGSYARLAGILPRALQGVVGFDIGAAVLTSPAGDPVVQIYAARPCDKAMTEAVRTRSLALYRLLMGGTDAPGPVSQGGARFGSWLHVPLAVWSRVVGVTCLASQRDGAFSPGDHQLLSTLAALASGTLGASSRQLHVSARQAQVLALIASGLSDKEVAARLGVAHRTVRTHLDRLLREHQLHNRTEAVAAWLRGLSAPIDPS